MARVVANAIPLEGNAIADGERVSFGVVVSADVERNVEAVDWSDSVIVGSRMVGTTVANSSFDRVVFHDCDFSGLTFTNCLLRDCVIVGARARSHLALDACILDGVTLMQSQLDRLEIHGCAIGALDCAGVTSARFVFHQCKAHKRRGRVSISGSELAAVGGLDTLGQSNVRVLVDVPLWRSLGDNLLRERGIDRLDESESRSIEALERAADDLQQRIDRTPH